MRMTTAMFRNADRVFAQLFVVGALLATWQSAGANPLGLTVASQEEAQALLQQMGLPELGPRKCLVVTAVDPKGPCFGVIRPGSGLRKVGGESVLDPESFEAVATKLLPGQDVLIEGLYVKQRPGGQGSWTAGKVTVRIPEPQSHASSESPTRPIPDESKEEGPKPSDRVKKLAKGEVVSPPPVRPKKEEQSIAANDDRAVAELTIERLQRTREEETARADAKKTPCVPFGLSISGFEGYDQNEPAYGNFDYSKGPAGEELFTVFYRHTFDDGGTAPATAEGYLTDGIDDLPGDDRPLERQVYLRQAMQKGVFRLHGRLAKWYVREDVPSIADQLSGKAGTAENPTKVYEGKVFPKQFAWTWGGHLHGVVRWWEEGDSKPFVIGRQVHGIPHLLEEQVSDKGTRTIKSWRFGYEHGGFGSYWSNGTARSQYRKNRKVEEGEGLDWYEDGGLKLRIIYVDGKADGKLEEWYPDGKRKSVGEWAAGTLVRETNWDKNGNRIVPKLPHEQFIASGERIANSHLSTMKQSVTEDRYQTFFNDFYSSWYLNQKAQMLEYPPGSNGHELAKGQLEGYRSVMAKHVLLP
jgi:hypothetical protein